MRTRNGGGSMKARVLAARRGRGVALATVATLAVIATIFAATGNATSTQKKYTIGVSNTLVGNGWREGMICSIKAQALKSGQVSSLRIAHRQTDTAGQIADIRTMISAGVNAIIINPSNANALKPIAAQARARGITVVFIDQYVNAPGVYNATNDQVAYGRLGAEWLFKKLGGKGNVVEMRGIAGVPADTDRHTGFTQALKKYPGIKVVKQTFTNWSFAPGGKQMLDILNSGVKVDGVWTSGIDYTIVNAFKTAGKPYVPVVGADNNEFLRQMIKLYPKFEGAAVTNPATIGGVGAAVAIKLLKGGTVAKWVKLTPAVWDMKSAAKTINSYYSPKRPPTYSSQLFIKPWTTYTAAQLTGCKGP